METPLTERQREILEFIRAYSEEAQRPPTVREIARQFGIASPKGVSDHLAALERKGYLSRTAGKARGLVLTHRGGGIPIVGRVAAGVPIAAIETIEGHVELEALFGRGECFAVQVQGDSMRDAGIHHGDLVIVRKGGRVESGEIAVAYVEGEATVKRLIKRPGGYRLQPENPAYAPLDLEEGGADFQLAGPVVGVIRSLRG